MLAFCGDDYKSAKFALTKLDSSNFRPSVIVKLDLDHLMCLRAYKDQRGRRRILVCAKRVLQEDSPSRSALEATRY